MLAPLRSRGLFRTRVSGRLRRITAIIRVVAGVVFVLFGVVKFIVPEYELAEFVRFGLPNLIAIVYLVGLLEIVGGVLLVLGLLTRLAAVALAANMAGAVLTAAQLAAWLGDRLPDAIVSHVAVGYLRPLGREPVTVTCTLDTVGRASFRTRETVSTEAGVAVEAATTLEVPGRALSAAEREALAQ